MRSLLSGLTNDDDITDLKERLNGFPADLEGYFDQMLSSIDDHYAEQTAKMLLSVYFQRPQNVLIYSYLNEKGPIFATKVNGVSDSRESFEAIQKTAMVRVKARCLDLLDFDAESPLISDFDSPFKRPAYRGYNVIFLHKTVKDWLLTESVQVSLKQKLKGLFNLDVYASNAILTLSKELKTLPEVQEYPDWWLSTLTEDLLMFCDQAEQSTGEAQTTILEHFERTVVPSVPDIPKRNEAHYLATLLRSGRCLKYVSRRLGGQPVRDLRIFKQPLLLFVVTPPSNRTVPVAHLLVTCGASPNDGPEQDTP